MALFMEVQIDFSSHLLEKIFQNYDFWNWGSLFILPRRYQIKKKTFHYIFESDTNLGQFLVKENITSNGYDWSIGITTNYCILSRFLFQISI